MVSPTSPPSEAAPSASSGSQGPPPAKKDYDESRIQVCVVCVCVCEGGVGWGGAGGHCDGSPSSFHSSPASSQVRLLDGSTLTAVFKAQEPLAAVRVYVQMNGVEGQDFTLLSPYPRRVYTDMDMEKPLRELGEYLGHGAEPVGPGWVGLWGWGLWGFGGGAFEAWRAEAVGLSNCPASNLKCLGIAAILKA